MSTIVATPDFPWKSRHESFNQALTYIRDRASGKITSLKCESKKINDAGIDGFEWKTAICIAARPAGGKSVLKEQLIREFFKCNSNDKFRVLDCDYEMVPMMTAIREFSSVLGKSYKYICSAEDDQKGKVLSKAEFDTLKEHVKAKQNFREDMKTLPIDVVENPTTVEEWEKMIELYMDNFSIKIPIEGKEGEFKIIYTNTVITVDHARLFKKSGQTEQQMLQELGEAIIRLKKKYPIIFIILNHLNRSVTDPDRCKDGIIGNYIVDGDILGSDALQQAMDIMIAIDRPANRRIKMYGPERYIIDDINLLIFHFLKVRNGEPRISFFKGEFEQMRIVETHTPVTAIDQSRVKS